jgi:DNA-directed RNA polymerase subunit RPC12/RpoP
VVGIKRIQTKDIDMQEITYELVCDDCNSDYIIINIVGDDAVEELPVYCPYCGSGVDVSNIVEEYDEMDELLEELDDLDFDVD